MTKLIVLLQDGDITVELGFFICVLFRLLDRSV